MIKFNKLSKCLYTGIIVFSVCCVIHHIVTEEIPMANFKSQCTNKTMAILVNDSNSDVAEYFYSDGTNEYKFNVKRNTKGEFPDDVVVKYNPDDSSKFIFYAGNGMPLVGKISYKIGNIIDE